MGLRWFSAACVILLAAGAAAAQEYILTGNDNTLWLVRRQDGNTAFMIVATAAGGKWEWEWVTDGPYGGKVDGAAAVGTRLHVLLYNPSRSSDYMIFWRVRKDVEEHAENSIVGSDPPLSLWPAGTAPLAVTEAIDFDGDVGASLVAITPRYPGPIEGRRKIGRLLNKVLSPWTTTSQPAGATEPAAEATTEPATEPATEPKSSPATQLPLEPSGLCVLQCLGDTWRHIADLPGKGAPPRRVLATAVRGTLYVMLGGRDGVENVLADWRQGRWQTMTLPAQWGEPLALLNLRNEPVLVCAVDANDGRRGLDIITIEAGGVRRQHITVRGRPFTWAAGKGPLISRFGDQIVLLSPQDSPMAVQACDTAGELLTQAPLDILKQGPISGNGEEIMDQFRWAVLLATLVPMFLTRPRTPPQPFHLPPTLRPGRFPRRIVAGIVDLAPFFFLGALTMQVDSLFPVPTMTFEEAVTRAQNNQVPDNLAYALIASLAAYTAYCIVMEMRYGATLGKMLLHLHVAGEEGQKPSVVAIMLRNLVRVLEISWLPLLLLLIVLPLLNRSRQRLGDMMSRTTVVETSPPADQEPQ